MSSGAIAILIALAIMLAITIAIAAFYLRGYRDASPEKQAEINQAFRRYAGLGGALFIIMGVVTMNQEAPYQGSWWLGAGYGGLGTLLLIAALIGIPAWGKRNQP